MTGSGFIAGIPTKVEVATNDFCESPQPCAVAPASQISFPPSPVFKRLDVPSSGLSSKDELGKIEVLTDLADTARREWVPFAYSYRSITKAIGSSDLPKDFNLVTTVIGGALEEGKTERLSATFEAFFAPSFDQICRFLDFLKDLPSQLKDALVAVAEKWPSDVFFMRLTNVLDLMYNLDELKVLKTGFQQDVSFYKRLKLKSGADPGMQGKFQELAMTLPIANKTLSDLKGLLEKHADKNKKFFVPVFTQYLQYCLRAFQNPTLMPGERNSIMLGIISVVYISGGPSEKLEPLSKLSIWEPVKQILAENPIVGLYAENCVRPGYLFSKQPGLKEALSFVPFEERDLRKRESSILIRGNIAQFREDYQGGLVAASTMARSGTVEIPNLLHVFSIISKIVSAIRTQFCYKMLVLSPDDAEAPRLTYDRGVRFNYSPEDFDALVEAIGYMKTLSGTLIEAEAAIVGAVAKMINAEIQKFILEVIDPVLEKIKGGKSADSHKILTIAREVIGGFTGTPAPAPPKSKSTPQPVETPATISTHELDVIRAEAQAFIRPDSVLVDKKKGVLKKDKITLIQAFIENSYSWYLLVEAIPAIREATNLSSLWFRELHLDLASKIQFPVRSSLPFILIEHLLTSQDHPELHDSMMFPFEIYNDCAYAALTTFRSQYLYREIEAEVSLSIDMLAFTFSETVYKYCLEAAAAVEVPTECSGAIVPKIGRYNVMVRQNKLQLLGSPVDFNLVATTKLNQKMRKELESYIELMTDVRLLPYVAHLIRVVQTTHRLLVGNNLRMDEYDTIWQRANCFTQPLSIQSNTADGFLAACDFPRWMYNADSLRFTSTKPLTITPLRKDGWPVAYANLHANDLKYIGSEHIIALVELLSPGELSHVVVDLTNKLEVEMFKFVEVYAQVASHLRVTSTKSKNDLIGFFNFNTDAYSELVIPNLGTLLNSMRVVGNIIALVGMIDQTIQVGDGKSLLVSVLAVIKTALENNRELFFQTGAFELCNVPSHRAFPALWCVLEVLMCVAEVRIDETRKVQALATFGDGPSFAAGIFISLIGQEHMYRFDSIVRRAVALRKTEGEGHLPSELSTFLRYGGAVASAMAAADRLAAPYK